MKKLSREDLLSLETYSTERAAFRERVIAHKKTRRVRLGEHATLCFEDRLTIQYQVQEMLRIERIFEAAGIAAELEAYNPLIPDGSNWKATFMVEYEDVEERRVALQRLVGIENKVWVRVDSFPPVFAIADEDMERSTQNKTSAVHFLRFELTPQMIAAAKEGAAIAMGIDMSAYRYEHDPVPAPVREALVRDLD